MKKCPPTGQIKYRNLAIKKLHISQSQKKDMWVVYPVAIDSNDGIVQSDFNVVECI